MNYIELINRFWEIDESWQFTSIETRLYFYLLKTANRLGWMNNWTHSDAKTSANVGVSVNAMKSARNRLVQAGLISFKGGGKGYGNKTRYQIMTPKHEPNCTPKHEPNCTPKHEPNCTPNYEPNHTPITKLNQTKQEENIPPNPQRGEVDSLSDFEKSVFEIWSIYSGKRNEFKKDLRAFCKKSEGVENINFEKLKKGAAESKYKNIYFQSWLNDVLPKKVPAKKENGFDLSFVDVVYIGIVRDFIQYRREIKKPFKTARGVKMFYNELMSLSNNNLQKAKELADYAKGREWQTVYPIRKNETNQRVGQTSGQRNLDSLARNISQGIARGAEQRD